MMLLYLVRSHLSADFLLIDLVASEPLLGLFFHVGRDVLWYKIDCLFTLSSMGGTASFAAMETLCKRWHGLSNAVVDDIM